MERLVKLAPEVAATGHGIVIHGAVLCDQLGALAMTFDALAQPKTGRYIRESATADASGMRSVPPPVVSPWVKGLLVASVALGAVALAAGGSKKKRIRSKADPHRLQIPNRYSDRSLAHRAAD